MLAYACINFQSDDFLQLGVTACARPAACNTGAIPRYDAKKDRAEVEAKLSTDLTTAIAGFLPEGLL